MNAKIDLEEIIRDVIVKSFDCSKLEFEEWAAIIYLLNSDIYLSELCPIDSKEVSLTYSTVYKIILPLIYIEDIDSVVDIKWKWHDYMAKNGGSKEFQSVMDRVQNKILSHEWLNNINT